MLYNQTEKQTFQINIKCLKSPTGGRQTSRLFTKCGQGVELGATENKSNELQGGGIEPGTTRLQAQHPNHSATLLPNVLLIYIVVISKEWESISSLPAAHLACVRRSLLGNP